jgi:hypothetical protein
MMSGEVLSVKEAFSLGYEFVKAATAYPGARVSEAIEAIFLGENGWTVEKELGTDVRNL